MLSRQPIRAIEAQSSLQRDDASASVRRAFDLLSRASADWRNGGGCESGALHWPVAITLARSELRQALKALDSEKFARRRVPRTTADCLDSPDADDARAGLAWYNSATVTERRHWHQIARSAVPADAWEAYKAGGSQS